MCQIRVNLRRWACLLAALACLLALLPLPAHAAQAASKVVRVGWYEDAYNITGKNGERSGENDCLLAESGEVAKYREDKRLHSVLTCTPSSRQ